MENKYSKSAALLERSKKVLAGGVSSEFRKYNYPHALFYSHAEGTKIYDVDGNEYLDFTLSQGPMILGHSHPEVIKAIESYSATGQLFAGQHIQEVELAEKLQSIIPSAELIRFSLSGSEAVQTAFRIARAKTGKHKFIRFEGHYHGWLDNVTWGLSQPSPEDLGDRSAPNVFPWTKGLPEHTSKEFTILPWNDLDLVKKTLAEQHHEIAAIITEPVMCNKGCILPNEGFLEGLRELCDEYGIALIFDEVITGFRLSLGGAQSLFGITPDLSIFAKAIANGYPISAIVGKKSWMASLEDGSVIHAGTLNSGNAPVAAALATISILERDKPHQRMFELGNMLKNGLREVAAKYGQNLLVAGPGPMVGSYFTDVKEIKDYRDTLSFDNAKLRRFIVAMQQEGIRIIGRGLWYISAAHTEKDITTAIQASDRVLKSL
ncbi:aspartate aminotransferase family protein [Membranihabitans marinus]|uniref:aspartate aminotransferase family protein n=1 Tax=Membranihabitans marinus TaxID=1227546 RepID=UPI001F35F558|nr:aspartate aminotransferase family protein [Membranihabitans marinus]